MLSIQDFNKGVDYTGLTEVTAPDLNNGVDLASPVSDSGTEGKGINIMTQDIELDIPTVPDASVVSKWKRYLWIRKPHSTASDTTPLVYGWDDNIESDFTFKKWVRLYPDINTFNAIIASQTIRINEARDLATTANTNATSANQLATEASNNASSALSQIEAITENSETAVDTANATAADLASYKTTVNAQLAGVTGKRNIADVLNPGLAFQILRTKSDATAVEWANQKDNIIILQETKAKNTSLAAASAGANLRYMDSEAYNTGASILSNPADGKFTLHVGTYFVEIHVPGRSDGESHQAFLMNDAANTVALAGTSVFMNNNAQAISIIKGVLVVAAATKYRISDYWSDEDADGLGKAANVAPSGGEVYTIATFIRL